MIATGHHHHPAVILIIPDHLGIAEIPAARIFSVLAGVLNHNWTVLGIFPCAPLILAVSQANPLVAVRTIRVIGSIIGNQAFSARIREQA
ncbi:hypothetical protein D3C75_1017600 [compost metagenome]